MKNKTNLIIGLLGLIAGLLIVLTFQTTSTPDALGQTSSTSANGPILMATSTYAGNGCACWIYDSANKKLVVYGVKSTNLSGLIGARACMYDFQLNEYPRQKPGVMEVLNESKKQKK